MSFLQCYSCQIGKSFLSKHPVFPICEYHYPPKKRLVAVPNYDTFASSCFYVLQQRGWNSNRMWVDLIMHVFYLASHKELLIFSHFFTDAYFLN